MYNFTKELYAFTNLPQPLPQPYFLSLPSALAALHPLTPPSFAHVLGAQDHKPPESSMLSLLFAPTVALIAFLFIKLTVSFQDSLQETSPFGSLPYGTLRPSSLPHKQFLLCVCLFNVLILE